MSRPGYGDRARIVSATSGKEWIGEVLVWGSTGAPFLRDEVTAETRWFPPSWVVAVDNGPGPRPCTCYIPGPDDMPESEPNIDAECVEHGDPSAVASAIVKKARSRE